MKPRPLSSKIDSNFSFVSVKKECFRKFLLSKEFNSFFIGLLLVILHLPPPVSNSLLPKSGFFSSNMTLEVLPAAIAAIIPAGPPPITAISYSFIISFKKKKLRSQSVSVSWEKYTFTDVFGSCKHHSQPVGTYTPSCMRRHTIFKRFKIASKSSRV